MAFISGEPGNYADLSDEDDDIDLLNDETFGDSQEAFDWEEATNDPNQDALLKPSDSQVEIEVRQLTLDDEPEDPAIITLHAHRIPTRHKDDLSDIYGSESPAVYTNSLDGLLHPSNDIWGSPISQGLFPQCPVVPSTTDDKLREAYYSSSRDSPTGSAGISRTPQHPSAADSPNRSAMPANAMTLEELERQLKSQAVPIPNSQAIPIPNSQAIQIPRTQSPRTGVYPDVHMGYQSNTPPMAQATILGQAMNRGVLPPRPQLPQPPDLQRMRFPPGLRPVQILRPPNQQSRPGEQANYGMRMPGSHHMPHPAAHMQMQRARMPGPPPMMMHNMSGMSRPPTPYQLHNPMHNANGGMRPPYDPYAGILTKYEKDWLVKIQLLQLHTEDPYTDDYYYTIHNLEKSHREQDENHKGDSHELILPALAKVETRPYKPLQFEGSLGRLTTSSVHKPRQILDIGEKDDSTSSQLPESRKYKNALRAIEKGYQLMLDIDECEKKIPSVLDDQKAELELQSKHKRSALYQVVMDSWFGILHVRKGRSLILRILPLIERDDNTKTMERIIASLPNITKRELVDPMDRKAVVCLEKALSHYNIKLLLSFTPSIETHMDTCVKTALGCYLIVYMIKQAEMILSAFVEVTEEQKLQWEKFVNCFLDAVSKLKTVPSLRGVQKIVMDHLQRFPDYENISSKIDKWFMNQ